ncbi:MAG: hypothetical protein A2381_06680 [Bdellovibrionales bacterium RIFOXYB1_FULL_37_110]|nr:MAG: hypothetical protein A2181_08700 [Bdellovibrionales bacterium RIFOXYA1_FULL_38_20]OFZ50227.1 MAG: hypothetical protein A2417_19530 [Bdellovibrionales bacterium RIFOXYC1_FULL_37_79]OFZ54456.1 MAG: hypothetical protein A2328_12170 [Bdellovibrionales bacterium RIFOXYB2_FULL_36_6]OFZ57664.1 MAG: hypothetical protein A2381_06680 [Bdellovibrionales bacterium RIFOXYB1_FULL_37_110]OFZ61431.1 MAG: hypothetical protein A2577_01045 [Bdellovibrionales bacterium RIFOXYD1_FULL_36_51]
MPDKKHKITILPLNKEIWIDEITDVRDALLQEGIKLRSICGGYAQCGMCKVKIIEGKEFISEIKFLEKGLLGNVFHITKERLSCQLYIKGDIIIEIPNPSGGHS